MRYLRQIDPVCAAEVNGFLCEYRTAVVDHYERRNVAEIARVAAFIEVIRIKSLWHSRARDSAVCEKCRMIQHLDHLQIFI